MKKFVMVLSVFMMIIMITGLTACANNSAPVAEISDDFHVTVDYSKSLYMMIMACKYYTHDGDITNEHFPVKGQGRVELDIKLVEYDQAMESDNVVKDLDQRGLRPVTLPGLLALGSQHPDTQQHFRVVALGSIWRDWYGHRRVPVLSGSGFEGDRYLRLGGWIGRWHLIFPYRFAAISK